MKLISCYITGFGTIKEWSYDFSDGMNALCQENGWGKTTFSVFLESHVLRHGLFGTHQDADRAQALYALGWRCLWRLSESLRQKASAIGSSVVLARRIRMIPLL